MDKSTEHTDFIGVGLKQEAAPVLILKLHLTLNQGSNETRPMIFENGFARTLQIPGADNMIHSKQMYNDKIFDIVLSLFKAINPLNQFLKKAF